jgi:ubiquinone/menaquinone biosynthesis C-methylase UbiE
VKTSQVDYNQFFDQKDDDLYTFDRRMTFRSDVVADVCTRLLKFGSSILDAGCGLGAVLASLPDGYSLNGFDYGEANVLRAKRRLKAKANIVQGSLYQIPFPDQTMDMVLCLEVLEHIENDDKALSEIGRVLKVDGYCIASVPSSYYWPEYLDLMGHYRHYTPQSFEKLLAASKLKVIQYLPKCARWQKKYMRKYFSIRLQHLLFGRLLRKGLYEFKYPWSGRAMLDSVARKLEADLQSEAKIDMKDGSTFVVAQKIG